MNSEKGSQDPKPHDRVKDFYDTEYYSLEGSAEKVSWHMRYIATRLGDLQDKEVLDVACGQGEWLAELNSRGAKMAGVDISSRAIRAASARLPNTELKTGVAESLPFEDCRFDVVTCLGSLEHFLDQPKALREMKRVAKPNAKFLILVPNAGFLTRRLGLYQGTQQTKVQETVRPLDEWRSMFYNTDMDLIAEWRDLHVISWSWIRKGPVWIWPFRAMQATALLLWPIAWQYQVYFLCRNKLDK